MKQTTKPAIDKKCIDLFTKLNKKKKIGKEITLADGYIGWKSFHPDLIPDPKSKSKKEFLCIARSTRKGIFHQGLLKPTDSDDYFIELKREGSDYTIYIHGVLKNIYSYDAIAFLQRGGHGIKQGEAFDILLSHGYTGAIFSPQLDNFSTKADKFHAKYLDEVGFTTHLRKNRNGIVQANLPTDPTDERFLLSMLAMIEANWLFFLTSCRAKLAVIDSKAEAGAIVSGIQHGINSKLRIALVAYTLYDNLSRIPKEMILSQKEYVRRLSMAGMKNYGVPDGLTFMREKINSVKGNKNSTILYMSFQDKKEILKRAKKDGVENLIVIPQMSPKISFGDDTENLKQKNKNLHVMRLNSSTYMQARNILSIFFEVARQLPHDKFFLLAKEEQVPIILPGDPPPNFKYLGWIETDRSLTKYIPMATTLWIHGGNRPSVIESLHANKKGVVPIFFTQDQLTIDAARFWGKRKLDIIKLLALMMAVEPMIERWEMLTTIVAKNKILKKLLINPLKPDINQIVNTIKNLPAVKPQIQKALRKLPIATTDLFADIYMALLKDKDKKEIERTCKL